MFNLISNVLALIPYKFYGPYAWLNDVYSVLPYILYALLALVGGAGTVYAVILGINLAKSESDDARKKAVDRLKNTIIGVAILLFLVLFINVLLPIILNAALGDVSQGGYVGPAMISALLH